MKLPHHIRRLLLAFFILHSSFCISASAPQARAEPGHQFPPLTPQETSAIESALPAAARAKPQKPRRLLVFYRTEGFVHQSIPNANRALQRMGELTGAFTVTLSDDMAQFDPATLATYDAVLFNNTTQLKFENPAHRRALLDFVRNGKGLIGIHAGSDNFPKWPEGQSLMGGVFHSHPWVSRDTVAVKNDDPGHILNTAFEKRGFWIKEEIYQIVGPYSREKQRVLLSLDMTRPENARPAAKLVRPDNDFPISWLKTEGAGRVFYTSLGHNKDIFEVPQILQHLLDGIQYALGDLEADALPSAKLKTKPKPALAPDDKTTLQQKSAKVAGASSSRRREQDAPPTPKSLATYEYGDPLAPQLAYEKHLRAVSPAQRATIETELIALIGSPKPTLAAKRVFLTWLGWIGTEKSIPTLTTAAKTPDLAHAAISALAAINASEADNALISLLDDRQPDSTRIEALNALGQRRSSALDNCMQEVTPATETASHEAAGNIDTSIGDMENAIVFHRDIYLPMIRSLTSSIENTLRRVPAEKSNFIRETAIKIYAVLVTDATDAAVHLGNTHASSNTA